MKTRTLKNRVLGLFSLLLLAASLLSPPPTTYAYEMEREVTYLALGEHCYKIVTKDGELIKLKRVRTSRCD